MAVVIEPCDRTSILVSASAMRLLHLTDLHCTANNAFQTDLIKSLLDDLKKEIASDGLDFIIFSGDLVNDPDEHEAYYHFETTFLSPVLQAAGLKPSNVIFCPGNHDISRRAVKEWADERKKMAEALRDQEALSNHLSAQPTKAYIRALSEGFYSLTQRSGVVWDDPLSHVYTFPDRNVSFVALNTAFGCGLEGSEHDRGKLALSTSSVLAAFQSVPAEHKVYSLAHHTMGDLNEASARVVIPVLSKHSDIHFFGHVHQPRPVTERAPGTSCFMVQGGALYEGKNIYNGYTIIDIGPSKETAARYRTYYIDRMQFDVGTNVNTGGVFYNSVEAQAYWNTAPLAPDNDDICLWLMDTIDGVSRELNLTITERTLTDTFVEPVITVVRHDDSSQRLTTAQIINGTDNLAISSDVEFGATSLLSYLTIQFHKECESLPRAVVPSFIDARRLRAAYPASVTSTLRSGLPDSDAPHLKLQPLHDCDRLVVIIDNIDPAETVHVAFLQAVRKQYPKARLIVAVKLPFLDIKRLRPALGINDFSFAQIGTLTRGKIRALVDKWRLPSRYSTDTVVEDIHSRFLALGIPQTAAYVVIYLSVLQEIDGFDPINCSTVIEHFVEGALQKYKPAYVFRSAFDYRNQIDYLGSIAERMCKKNSFLIAYEDLYAWTKTYFDELGIEHDISKLIQHFVSIKVFSHQGNAVYFRYNIFLSFFIAHQMTRSAEFKKWIIAEHRYTNYITEIDIYCGLSRQDVSLLEFFASEFGSLSDKLEEYVRPLAWTDRLEKLSIPAAKEGDAEKFTDRITRQLTSDMPPEKRDEAVSEGVVQSGGVTPDLKRPEVVGLLPLWVLTLRALTVSLKNLENIPRETKEKNLTRILEGWSTVLLYACIVFKEVVEKQELDIGPMKFKLYLPPNIDARELRLIFLSIPIYISNQLRRDLGSQKLAMQLRKDELAKTLSDSFLQTGLYADLKLSEYLGKLRALKEKATEHGSHLILEALLIKLRDIFLRLGIHDNERNEFIRIAAEISAQIKGLSGEERQKEIDSYSTSLRRLDQVNKLRESSR